MLALVIILQMLSTIFLDTETHTGTRISGIWLSWFVSEAKTSSCPHPLSTQIIGIHEQFLILVLGICSLYLCVYTAELLSPEPSSQNLKCCILKLLFFACSMFLNCLLLTSEYEKIYIRGTASGKEYYSISSRSE